MHADPAAAGERPAARRSCARSRTGPARASTCCRSLSTSKPVDLDLVNNTLRLPYRERLAIILNELGTGLAGRGGDLRQAIVNANPALKQTDQVLAILADQNRVLANLARDSDTILAPLARDRAKVADFVTQANVASAGHGRALERARAEHRQAAGLPARADADDGSASAGWPTR